MKYKKRKKIAALSEAECKAELLALGIKLPEPTVFPDNEEAERKDFVFAEYYRELDAGRPRYPVSNDASWTWAHSMLFKYGVTSYVKKIGRAELDRLLEQYQILISPWHMRTIKRPAIEKLVIEAILKSETDKANDEQARRRDIQQPNEETIITGITSEEPSVLVPSSDDHTQ